MKSAKLGDTVYVVRNNFGLLELYKGVVNHITHSTEVHLNIMLDTGFEKFVPLAHCNLTAKAAIASAIKRAHQSLKETHQDTDSRIDDMSKQINELQRKRTLLKLSKKQDRDITLDYITRLKGLTCK